MVKVDLDENHIKRIINLIGYEIGDWMEELRFYIGSPREKIIQDNVRELNIILNRLYDAPYQEAKKLVGDNAYDLDKALGAKE